MISIYSAVRAHTSNHVIIDDIMIDINTVFVLS